MFHDPRPIQQAEKSIAYVGAKLWNKVKNKVRNIDLLDGLKMPRDFKVLKYGSRFKSRFKSAYYYYSIDVYFIVLFL